MTAVLDANTLSRWRADPISFIEQVLIDPESGKPFVLNYAERTFLALAFTLDESGRLKYPELVFGAIKKSGKTTLAAIIMLVMVLLFGGRFAEGYCVANDLEQAVSRVFTMCKRMVEASPLLKREAKVMAERIVFPALDAVIVAIGSDYASAAGANPTISCFDESWAYTSERSHRLWDEMITSPARRISCRLTVSYAGFTGESSVLEELHGRGLALPEVGPSLHAGDGMLFAWHTKPIAPWQTEAWLAEMRRSLRPSAYARMIENQFVAPESKFVDMSLWDACTQPDLLPLLESRATYAWIGVDASVRRDSTAIVAVTLDRTTKVVRLLNHKVFTPSASEPIDFALIEQTLLQWNAKYIVRAAAYDPYQMIGTSQRLAKAHVPMVEVPQTVPNLSQATSNLLDLLASRSIVLYPDAAMRLAASRAVLVEGSRGLRISKDKASHKIDVVVALSLAALIAVRQAEEPYYASPFSAEWDAAWGDAGDLDAPARSTPQQLEAEKRYADLLQRYGQPVSHLLMRRE